MFFLFPRVLLSMILQSHSGRFTRLAHSGSSALSLFGIRMSLRQGDLALATPITPTFGGGWWRVGGMGGWRGGTGGWYGGAGAWRGGYWHGGYGGGYGWGYVGGALIGSGIASYPYYSYPYDSDYGYAQGYYYPSYPSYYGYEPSYWQNTHCVPGESIYHGC